MNWACFLHFYQPPTQSVRILKKVTDESYRRIIEGIEKLPNARLTLNVTSCLVDLWAEHGLENVIRGLRSLLKDGKIELTASAKYHPLLPKLPRSEIKRQILLDIETHKKYFGDLYRPKGFFPPEMAYNRKMAEVVAELDFEWVIAEELSYDRHFGHVQYDRVYEIKGIDSNSELLKIFFRERNASFKILSGQLGTPKLFKDYLGERINRHNYLLTAMDGETFGHHRPGMEELLFSLLESEEFNSCTISQLASLFENREVTKTYPSTWALMEKDLERNAPFSRWDDPGNLLHQLQWELTYYAIGTVYESAGDLGVPSDAMSNSSVKAEFNSVQQQWFKSRQLLDRSLHSDQYWWASARPWWSLEMIEQGAYELKTAVLSLPNLKESQREKVKELYYDIITLGFDWQRSGKVEELSRREDEEIRERTDQGLPQLPAEEVDKMIASIRKEMRAVAEKEEYERAAQLRDRIQELEDYKDDKAA